MKDKVGLGTFPLASVFGKVLYSQAQEIVKAFIENGGYYIDTAPLYGFGEIEKLLGKVLKKYPREKYYLATKCGYINVEGKTFQTVQKSGQYDDVIKECDRSLQRLNVDYIDLYFVHSPDPKTPFPETMKALVKLKTQGKIKEIGVSNVNLKELKEYNKNGEVRYIQNRFSLINRSINGEFKSYLLKHDIKLIPYHLLEIGQLSSKIFRDFNLGPKDLRKTLAYWKEEKLKVVISWIKENLDSIASKLDVSIEQLVIAWALCQEFIDFVIVGATNKKQVVKNLKADSIKLSSSMLKQIDDSYKELKKEIKEKFGQTVREFRGLNEKFY